MVKRFYYIIMEITQFRSVNIEIHIICLKKKENQGINSLCFSLSINKLDKEFYITYFSESTNSILLFY
jgi:hypothetical protein